MAGHSKWAKTKRLKAVLDARKGKVFSAIAKELTLAAKAGGGNAEFNPRLRTLIGKAKASNMPADNIERAIMKGTGELPGVEYVELLYEGYGPGGVGLIVQVTTDNKNRAAGEVRAAFTKYGGNIAGPGALQHFFQRKGHFIISAEQATEERLLEIGLEAGAEDVLNQGDHFDVRCDIGDFDRLSEALEKAGIATESAEIAYLPTSFAPVTEKDVAQKFNRLVEALEELDDVQNVFDNSEMAPELVDA